MALIQSLNTGVSGLLAQQFRIEVTGNNIANVDTTAFKGSRVDFASLLSSTVSFGASPAGSLGGIDPVQVGLGTRVASSPADFSQGSTEITGLPGDLSIRGSGFFVLAGENGDQLYTRDGSFGVGSTNLLIDPSTGLVVQGYRADENFQVNPAGALENLEIPLGAETIAQATTRTTYAGNLNAGGPVASQGTQLLSDSLFDDRFTNDDLISATNPLGLDRASADTPLANLVRSLGDFTSFDGTTRGTAATASQVFPELTQQPSGVDITVTGLKGQRARAGTFTVGDPPPTGGTTLGEFMEFLESTLGIHDGVFDGAERTEHTYSHVRLDPQTGEEVNGTLSLGSGGGPDDTATLGGLTDNQADFRSVRVGDYIRFTSGQAAGQFAEITGISASVAGGGLDTLAFRTDGFNSLTTAGAIGDTYAVHAPADVDIAAHTTLHTVSGSSPTVSVGAAATSGEVRSFTILDSSVTDFGLARGISENQRVDYLSGGQLVSGTVAVVNGNTITVSFDATLTQDPDAATDFTLVDLANGTIDMAGNVGTVNDISDVEITSGGTRVGFFDGSSPVAALGESVTLTSTVYDSLGTPRQVQLSFVFEGSSANGPNVWRYFAESLDDADQDPVVGSGTVLFGANGAFLTTGSASEVVSVDLAPTSGQPGGVATPFTFELDLSRLTQLAATDSEVQLQEQDGFESGTLESFAVGANGLIQGIFTNGLVRTVGQIALANFANPQGLSEEGANLFQASPNSGLASIGTPGSFGRGTILAGSLEESNVDLAEQFTDLIIGQRAFQANARTISVSDEMLQELVNLI